MESNEFPKNTLASEEERGEMAWRIYKMMQKGNSTIRSGMWLCGCYPHEEETKVRPESVNEHTFGTMRLLYLLSVFFPYLFGFDCKNSDSEELAYLSEDEIPIRTSVSTLVSATVFDIMKLLMFHDQGETQDDLGDMPDDGSQNHNFKKTSEANHLKSLVCDYPSFSKVEAKRLLRDFKYFDDFSIAGSNDIVFQMIQIARLCDKIETLLSITCYEMNGHPGDLRFKEEHYGITDQDRHFIEVCHGDSTIVTSWTAHTIRDYHKYYGFKQLMCILRAGIIECRGAWFPWWKEYTAELGIPDYGW